MRRGETRTGWVGRRTELDGWRGSRTGLSFLRVSMIRRRMLRGELAHLSRSAGGVSRALGRRLQTVSCTGGRTHGAAGVVLKGDWSRKGLRLAADRHLRCGGSTR